MTQIQELPGTGAQRTARSSLEPARLFYTAAATIMLLLTFAGFSRFYLHGMAYPGREIAPPIRTLVIAHGAAMSAWVVLMVVQPLLIVRGSRALHMNLGKFGAALAAAIVVSGVWLAIQATRVTPAEMRIWNLSPTQFLAVPLSDILIFAAFVSLAVYHRRRPQIHRPMMLLATLSVMTAAIARIDPLNNLYVGTVWERMFGPYFLTLVLGAVLVAVRCAMPRSSDRWLVMGMAVLIAARVATVQMAPTAGWTWVASMLVR